MVNIKNRLFEHFKLKFVLSNNIETTEYSRKFEFSVATKTTTSRVILTKINID